ncbi:MAG: NADH-quinone oxidoreductase subunit J [Actinomycetota bacterium]|nr:NADH-quinone oxidoreductase subunit J [Actinomycetota bacterium]
MIAALAPRAHGVLGNAASSGVHLAHASAWVVFVIGGVLILAGAFGVVLLRNPVHCALMLVTTLFGVAVEFIDQQADFLAAVQIIVYAGAVVILFLFVIMFLGVDRKERVAAEAFRGQKPLAAILGVITLIELLVLSRVQHWTGGTHSLSGPLVEQNTAAARAAAQAGGPLGGQNIAQLGQSIYTRYLLPFEMTSALLVIAVVATVVLARQSGRTASEMTKRQQDELRTRISGPQASGDQASGPSSSGTEVAP